MGIGLYQTFVDAGLPPPAMHLEAPIGAAKTWAGYRYMATIFQSLLPLLKKYELATAEQVDVDTLARTNSARGYHIKTSLLPTVTRDSIRNTSNLNSHESMPTDN